MSTIALIVEADEPALFFSSVSGAEGYLEAIDVNDGVYPVAYGPDGQVFQLKAIGDHVQINPVGGSKAPDELRALLLRYLSAAKQRDVKSTDALSGLLARCEAAVI
ncbi:hypothetical protein ER13_17750 [Brevundimonas sp. EAKA]|jgi:hypothetical protein|uniref:hypothetical protein n=1 Tax=Brevundimonas sp. EAKA TaxID=1495854 RepID=UPI0004A91CC8|nr:hypothetical protein [Brevundimonas sp. EAKA]KDP93609.1 hypothetical protein ER13_17750 [Brevundimonas sp. EAKA]